MSQLILTEVGGDLNDTITLDRDPDLTLGAEDLLVAVEAAPVNPADLLFTAGWFSVQPQPPAPLGAEGVGRVLQAGSRADQSLVGRRVLLLPTFRHGTWAERTVVAARDVVPISETADAVQLAMLPVNPATAYGLLHDYTELKPGDWIGLTLANSAVGQHVITLAKRAGVRVVAVVRRAEAAEQVRQLGADLVVLDGEGLGDRAAAALGEHRLRLLLDGTGGPQHVGELARVVEDGGSVVTFGAITGQAPVLPLGDFIYRSISLRSFFILSWIRDKPREQLTRIYAELAELVEEGVLRAEVEATYPLERFAEALAHAGRERRSGKILFTPATAA
ncbi:zinc-dependent alcohol dehydrogenase family protein [Micromonospora krabiensis]|uniref:enoyl-[acyl-carrier-protein] reductase n=1 Tax=Micromonospora krabiensis TaxID=307121 RepID=A0A1C3MXX2_9ACTN|nr:zinc-dependent alcohol dehydrogenase family protein [Micromonospora krabiensis]SBV25186.1 NADPH:quinone reductase [Micromonospora krabiensis]